MVLCADNDGVHSATAPLLDKIKTHLDSQGAQVMLIQPEKAGQDFNDVLKTQGVSGVQKILKTLPYIWRVPIPPKMTERPQGLDIQSQNLSRLFKVFNAHPTKELHKEIREEVSLLKTIYVPHQWEKIKNYTADLSKQVDTFEKSVQQKNHTLDLTR